MEFIDTTIQVVILTFLFNLAMKIFSKWLDRRKSESDEANDTSERKKNDSETLENMAQTIGQMTNNVADLTTKYGESLTILQEQDRRIKELERDGTQKDSEIAELKTTINNLQLENETMKEELTSKISRLKEENDDLKNKFEAEKTITATLRKRIVSLEKERKEQRSKSKKLPDNPTE